MLKGGILKNDEERVDTSDIHENVVTRVNEAQASKCGTCENTYLRQMLPAPVTAISVAIVVEGYQTAVLIFVYVCVNRCFQSLDSCRWIMSLVFA